MKFIVDRQKWYRGHGQDTSRLLLPDGQRCCIGFVGQQSGISDADLINMPSIASTSVAEKFPAWMQTPNAQDIHRAYNINDSRRLTYVERELQLKALFSKHGDEIEFISVIEKLAEPETTEETR